MNEELLNKKVKIRKKAIKLYEEIGSFTKVGEKYNVHRSTIQRWLKRYEEEGVYCPKSSRPKTLPLLKVTPEIEKLILELRWQNNIGSTKISKILTEKHGINISYGAVVKVLNRNNALRSPHKK